MNFRGSGSGRAPTVVDITALVDVVFQLLIFFLLTSSYVSSQAPSMDVQLPEASVQALLEQKKDFSVTIQADGTLVVDDGREVGVDELGVELTRVVNRDPDTIVLIRGDREVNYGRVVEVMGMAKALNLQVSVVYRSGG